MIPSLSSLNLVIWSQEISLSWSIIDLNDLIEDNDEGDEVGTGDDDDDDAETDDDDDNGGGENERDDGDDPGE